MQKQIEKNWCWAAVSASVGTYVHGKKLEQCRIATETLKAGGRVNLDCCKHGSVCDVPWKLDLALSTALCLRDVVNYVPPLADIVREISAGLPVCIRYNWLGTNKGHFCLIKGVSDDGRLYLADPFYGDTLPHYRDAIDKYQENAVRWTHTYFVEAGALPPGAAGDDSGDPFLPLEIDGTIETMKLERFLGDTESIANGGGMAPKRIGFEVIPDDDSDIVFFQNLLGATTPGRSDSVRRIRSLVERFGASSEPARIVEFPTMLLSVLWLVRDGLEYLCPFRAADHTIRVGEFVPRSAFEDGLRGIALEAIRDAEIENRMTKPGKGYSL